MKGTIHIFGYGEAQIVSDAVNFKTNISAFTKLQAVIDNVKSKKPADKSAWDYHAINIFLDLRADYVAQKPDDSNPTDKNAGSFSVKIADLDSAKITALIAEFTTLSQA